MGWSKYTCQHRQVFSTSRQTWSFVFKICNYARGDCIEHTGQHLPTTLIFPHVPNFKQVTLFLCSPANLENRSKVGICSVQGMLCWSCWSKPLGTIYIYSPVPVFKRRLGFKIWNLQYMNTFNFSCKLATLVFNSEVVASAWLAVSGKVTTSAASVAEAASAVSLLACALMFCSCCWSSRISSNAASRSLSAVSLCRCRVSLCAVWKVNVRSYQCGASSIIVVEIFQL